MRETFAGISLVLVLSIGGGFSWAINRTWTGEHTTFLLGGGMVLAALLGIACIVAAWSYGTTHGAGVSQGSSAQVIEMLPRTADPSEERLQLDNAIRREKLFAMQAERPSMGNDFARLPMVPDWAEEGEA